MQKQTHNILTRKRKYKLTGGNKEDLEIKYIQPDIWIRTLSGFNLSNSMLLRQLGNGEFSPFSDWNDFYFIYNELTPNFETYSDIENTLNTYLKEDKDYKIYNDNVKNFTLFVFNSYREIIGKPIPRPEHIAQTVRTILGKGNFGLIISPAFSNGNVQINTNTVSKIFKDKKDMDKILTFINDVLSKIPLIDTGITPYKKTYTVANANRNIIKNGTRNVKIKNILQILKRGNTQSNRIKNSSVIYQIRMPNFGYSIFDIDTNPKIRKQIVTIDYKKISMEILKLLCTVKQIYRMGFIHGDITEKNIMCNINTNKLTLIDFDLFNTIDNFPNAEFLQSYSLPPECRVIFPYDEPITGLFSEIDDRLEYICKVGNGQFYNSYLYELYRDITVVKSNIQTYIDKENAKDLLYKFISQFMDSWGLALTIHRIFKMFDNRIRQISYNKMYVKSAEDTKICDYIQKTLLPNMLQLDMKERWNADTATSNYNTFLKSNINEYYTNYLKENTKVSNELYYNIQSNMNSTHSKQLPYNSNNDLPPSPPSLNPTNSNSKKVRRDPQNIYIKNEDFGTNDQKIRAKVKHDIDEFNGFTRMIRDLLITSGTKLENIEIIHIENLLKILNENKLTIYDHINKGYIKNDTIKEEINRAFVEHVSLLSKTKKLANDKPTKVKSNGFFKRLFRRFPPRQSHRTRRTRR